MYSIVRTKIFERSYKRLERSGAKRQIFTDLENIIDVLASGRPLVSKYHDHKLIGELAGYRECHVRPNLLLIYQINDNILVLVLVDIGFHPQLFS